MLCVVFCNVTAIPSVCLPACRINVSSNFFRQFNLIVPLVLTFIMILYFAFTVIVDEVRLQLWARESCRTRLYTHRIGRVRYHHHHHHQQQQQQRRNTTDAGRHASVRSDRQLISSVCFSGCSVRSLMHHCSWYMLDSNAVQSSPIWTQV